MKELSLTILFKEFKSLHNIIRIFISGVIIITMIKLQLKIKKETQLIKNNPPKEDYAVTNINHLKRFCYELPPGSVVGYVADTVKVNSAEQGLVYQSTYNALAPTVFLGNEKNRDTIVCQFYRTGSMEHPLNPLHTQRAQWRIIKDFEQGVFLMTKSKKR